MKKIVIALFVVCIVMFAAVRGGLWYVTQQFVDNQVALAQPFAKISYKEIKTSLTGSATVTKLKVFIPVIDETIYIESIQFLAADLISLLSLDYTLQQKQLPESLILLVSGITIDLNGKLMSMMDNPEVEPTPLETFSTLACGDIYRIGSKALLKMGYDNFTTDIVLRYQFIPRKKLLTYDIRNNIRDMTHINLSGEIQGISDLNSFNTTAHPGKIKLQFIDDSYIERKNSFCARQGKRKVDEYINEHTTQVKEYLASYGIEPEEGLLNAYKTLLVTSGAVTFEADLSQLTGLEEFKTFEPNDIIQFMRLRLYVNDKRINEISIAIDKARLIETATVDDAAPETPDEIKKKKVIIIKKYHPISIAALTNYNGYRVKIETINGKHFRGKINSKDRKIYEVITRMRSGNISYHLPVKTIKKAEVFY